VVPAAVPTPEARCSVGDPRLTELSGLAVVGDDLWAMADGGRRVELLRLDPRTCAVLDRRSADVDPYDPEDLAVGPDGSLWVGDVGDNDRRRATVALIVVPPQGPTRLHRLTYPDGPHDAEALLVDAHGAATVVTKDIGAAGVYQPEGALTGGAPVPLVHVADLTLPSSATVGGPLGGLGSRTVTGGAVSPDGRVVALRTYTDAWLYAAPDGDVRAALRGTPVRVPLPDEPQGEAIAFTRDGTLLSGSETRGGVRGQLRAVPGAAALVGATTPMTSTVAPPPTAVVAAPTATRTPVWGAAAGAGIVVLLGLLAAALVRRVVRRR
jgi:hypothetical protein